MVYSIHTFELTLSFNTSQYKKQLSAAYKKSKGRHRLYAQNSLTHHDCVMVSKGIKIEYENGTYKKKVKLIINPSKILGGNDLQLWNPKKQTITLLLKKLEAHIDDYFDGCYSLDDFMLTRVDYTVNIDVGNRENVSAYIKTLQKLGKVKGFSPKYSNDDKWDEIDKNLSFDLEGNSNGMEFTAYDKEAQMKQKKASKSVLKAAKGILRIEIRLLRQKAIRRFTDKTTTADQIRQLAKQSETIFSDTFQKVVPRGDYYKKKKASELIENSTLKKKQKNKMLRLLDLIPRKKSMLTALKELDERHVDHLMANFNEIGISPVTIPKRVKMNYLESLYNYL